MSEENFSAILGRAISVLKRERSEGKTSRGKLNSGLLKLEAPENLVLVGDLHGDQDTLLKILAYVNYQEFLENPNNKIIFLGDYVDRGINSAGVLYTIMKLKMNYSDSVVLMRGNHEAPAQFPFPSHSLSSDLKREFPNSTPELYERILSFFELLTVATIIDAELVIVHGGLPITPPQIRSESESILKQERSLEQLLWNDPKDEIDNGQNWQKSRRDFGYYFSESITNQWLSAIGAKVVVRGHEPCLGVHTCHSDRVVTLFSSKQPYPKFEAAIIKLSTQELLRVSDASDLVKSSILMK